MKNKTVSYNQWYQNSLLIGDIVKDEICTLLGTQAIIFVKKTVMFGQDYENTKYTTLIMVMIGAMSLKYIKIQSITK